LNMSRSLGDILANSVGVSNVPDVKEYAIQPDDLFIVIASDGIWEFMSNKEVIDEINEFGR
jgi:serine/threonine protein phosphatase PrpC